MTEAANLIDELARTRTEALGGHDIQQFTREVLPVVARSEEHLNVTEIDISLRFDQSPTAAALARALDEVDREARRVVAAREKGVPPYTLRGRGVRLKPRSEGLVVRKADPGSLDVLLLLGGLYATVVSEPVSFVLNMATLMEYGKVVIRQPRGRKSEEIVIRLPQLPSDAHEYYIERIDRAIPAGGEIRIPSDYSDIAVRIKGSDGTSIKLDLKKQNAGGRER